MIDKMYNFANAKQKFSQEVLNDRGLLQYKQFLEIPEFMAYELFAYKKILNIGGGLSPLARDLRDTNIPGFHITNIEPYAGETSMDNQDILIESDFLETNFQNEFDTVISLYSMPYYAENSDGVFQTYKKAFTSLTPGGVLRFYPAFDFEYNYNKHVQKTLNLVKLFNKVFPQTPIYRLSNGGIAFIAPDNQKDKQTIDAFFQQNQLVI